MYPCFTQGRERSWHSSTFPFVSLTHSISSVVPARWLICVCAETKLMGLHTPLCFEKVGISIASSTWKRRYRSVAHTWVWNSFDRSAHLTGLLRSLCIAFWAHTSRACYAHHCVHSSHWPPDGWRRLCAPQVEKSCRNLFSYFMEVPSRIKQDGEGGKERWLILCSAGAFGLPRYMSPSVPSTRQMKR